MTPLAPSLLHQVKKRRLALGLKQHDMLLQAGISRQQYQRLEAKGNPRLNTLELVAQGLKSELLLIPQEKLAAVMAVLDPQTAEESGAWPPPAPDRPFMGVQEDPWQGLLGDDSEYD